MTNASEALASLCDLPADLMLNISERYLNLQSLARLDSAVCNRAARSTILSVIAHVRVTQESAYPLDSHKEWKFDPVLCMRWMVWRKISVQFLVLPNFITPPVYPPFDEEAFPDLVELHVVDATGWWEELLPMCHNVKILELQGNRSSVFFPMETISKYLTNLEVLRLQGQSMQCAEESRCHELQFILCNCPFLREITLFGCELTLDTIEALVDYKVSFIATTIDGEIKEAILNDMPVKNVALLGHHCCFFWQDASVELVASYVQKLPLDPNIQQTLVKAFSRCNTDELVGLVQVLSIY